MDEYFSRPEVSNSDLSWLKEQLIKVEELPDPTEAFRFGTLIDCMITEPEKVDFFKRTCDGQDYTKKEFETAQEMKKAFFRDELCQKLVRGAEFQKVMAKENEPFIHGHVIFRLSIRCKWDFWNPITWWGGDIKSTTATTQRQFEEAIDFFDYDRQRAWYMNIAGSRQDILIGISKKNFKVFKVPIRQGDKLHQRGTEKYEELAFKWFQLFGDMKSFEVNRELTYA